MQTNNKLYEQHGTNQDQRFLEAMDFDYVKVDELSFEDLLVFATGFSHLIKFYEADNTSTSDWSQLFIDETFVIAEIITYKPTETEAKFKLSIENMVLFRREQKKIEYLEKAIGHIYSLATLIDHWITKLVLAEQKTNTELKLRNELDELLESRLNIEISKLKIIAEYIARQDKKKKNTLFEKNPLRQFDVCTATDETHGIDNNSSLVKNIPALAESLENIFNIFYQSVFFLKNKSEDYMKASLKRNNHLPQIALYLTFIKLYKHARDNINRFNERFLEYYYKKILQTRLFSYKASKVYLTIEILENIPELTIPKNEQFLAGEDKEGNNIIFSADNSSKLNQVKIKSMQTAWVSKGVLNIKGVPTEIVTNIYKQNFPTTVYETKDNKTPFKSFGIAQTEISLSEKKTHEANTGFAFSSGNLYLQSGKRSIDIEFVYNQESFRHLTKYIDDFASASNKLRNEILDSLFLNAFSIEISTKTGWFKIKKYSAYVTEKENKIHFSFCINQDVAAIVPVRFEVHKEHFNTRHPVVKFTLNSDTYIYAYSIIQKLEIDSITVEADVEDFNALSIYNHLGELSLQNVFQPFGPMPKKGHYFILGSNEVFYKELNQLKIKLNWFELPETNEGFQEYYKDYNLEYTNSSFKAKLSMLNAGKWKPGLLNDRQEFELFSEDAEKRPEKERLIDEIEITKIWSGFQNFDYENEVKYDHQAQFGFMKFELSAPDTAFGHDVYPSLLASGLAQNSKGMNFLSSGKTNVPNFNQPYTPKIESISLDYKAKSAIQFSETAKTANLQEEKGEKFYHLYPNGKVCVYPKASVRKVNMLPDFNFEACLFIGLSDVSAPQTVTFLFEIRETAAESSDVKEPIIEWQFLADDKWDVIEPSKIYMDETENFKQTGIVSIELPDNIQKGNKQLDENLYWIRAVIYKNTETTGSILTAHTQAFTATLELSEKILEENYGKNLPAKTIKQAIANIQGIGEINQPLPSFIGYKAEETRKYYQRISEKLKHKNRAISIENFEKIVLANFPQIYQVNCFPNMSENGLNIPGNVLLVVVPYLHSSLDKNEPKVGNKLLVEIKNHLQKISSPFIHIEVKNPIYEHIKVVCKLKLKSGFSKGFYQRELNKHLTGFLYGDSDNTKKKISLGGSIYISDILSFIRTLPYVDSIAGLSLLQIAKDFRNRFVLIDTATEGEKNYIQASKPWTVLVPFQEHDIRLIGEDLTLGVEPSGIGKLKLGSQFVVQ